jgi:preprotein translocase subunit SecA
VRIQEESRTMATITFQNLFRIYKKLSGMTGTADTEAAEFHKTYKLDVVIIPTNKPIIRKSTTRTSSTRRSARSSPRSSTRSSRTTSAGSPILVGTTSVEKSAAIAKILKKKKIKHEVLNAKHHENEAYVVAQAGRKGAITVSTNMAGRGTDIILGGNPEMLAKLEFKESNREPEAEPGGVRGKLRREARDRVQGGGRRGRASSAASTSSAPSATSRAASTTSSAAAPAARAIRARQPLLPLPRRRPHAHLRGDRVKNADGAHGHARRRAHRAPVGHEERRERAEEGRGAQLRHPQEPARIRRRDERAAQDRLRLRQQLLLGRYFPEIVDEEGKPTGEKRRRSSRSRASSRRSSRTSARSSACSRRTR